VLEILESHIKDNSIDFIYCLGMTFHYDTNEIETSPYLEDVLKSFVRKLKPTGILFYSWHTIKSDKAYFPVSKESLGRVLDRINITNYQMRINPVNRFNNPTLECIIRKNK
jgi:SAM-dependent methyltransferase